MNKKYYYAIEGGVHLQDYSTTKQVQEKLEAIREKHGFKAGLEWHPDWGDVLLLPQIYSEENMCSLWSDLVKAFPNSHFTVIEHMEKVREVFPDDKGRVYTYSMEPRLIKTTDEGR